MSKARVTKAEVLQFELKNDDIKFKSGLPYLSVGKFLEYGLVQRGISLQEASRKSGLMVNVLSDLIEDRKKFDRDTARKLKAIFPKSYKMFPILQAEIDNMNPEKIKWLKENAPKPNVY